MVVVEAVKEGGSVQRPPVQEIVTKTRSLPSLPVILTRIMELISSEKSNVKELERLIKKDQSLSCKVMAAANSAYCGLTQKVETISRGIVVLGFQKVKECCLGAGLMGVLCHGSSLNEEEAESLWKHSLATAEAATLVAARTGRVDTDLAFTAGLLHDLGKVLLVAYLAEVYGRGRYRSWRDAETVLGLDHQELGLGLAEHWNLPPVLAEAMARHHCPDSSLTYADLVATVHAADCLAGFLEEAGPAMPLPQAMEQLWLTPEELNFCLEELIQRYRHIEELWVRMSRA